MKKKIERFLEKNAIVIVALIDLVMLLALLWMILDLVVDTAALYTYMRAAI